MISTRTRTRTRTRNRNRNRNRTKNSPRCELGKSPNSCVVRCGGWARWQIQILDYGLDHAMTRIPQEICGRRSDWPSKGNKGWGAHRCRKPWLLGRSSPDFLLNISLKLLMFDLILQIVNCWRTFFWKWDVVNAAGVLARTKTSSNALDATKLQSSVALLTQQQAGALLHS